MTPPRTIGRLVSAVATEPRAAHILSATPEPALPPDEIDRALRFVMRIKLSLHAKGFRIEDSRP